MKFERRKVVKAKGAMKESNDGLHWNFFCLYASFLQNVDQSLLAVSNRLTEMFGCVAKALQQT